MFAGLGFWVLVLGFRFSGFGFGVSGIGHLERGAETLSDDRDDGPARCMRFARDDLR